MTQILLDHILYVVITPFFLVIAFFIYLSIKIKVSDIRSRRAARKPKLTLITDGREVDMSPYVRDVSFSSSDPPEWATRIADLPDASVTIEMETITEEDHGTSRSRPDPRTGEAD